MTKMVHPVVIDTTRSAHSRLRPLPITAIRLTDGFWATCLHTTRTASLPMQYRLLTERGRLDNFRRVVDRTDAGFQGGYCFNDSDVYKWLEAASWTLASNPEEEGLRRLVDEIIDLVAAAQR